MYTILAFLGAVLVGAGITYILGSAFGRQETYPPVSRGVAYERHYENLSQSSITANNIAAIQFGMSLRGYTMSEVDLYLKRIEEELAWYEQTYGPRIKEDQE